MGGTRIYVGNLSVNIKEAELVKKFSQYGNIVNIELKSKLDIEGNPNSQFAYLNLEAEPARVEDCIRNLNNFKLSGSYLKVEIARESFLDKLKREREQANNPKPSTTTDYDNSYNFSSTDYNAQRYRSHHERNTDNSYDPGYDFKSNDHNTQKYRSQTDHDVDYNSSNFELKSDFSKYDHRENNENWRLNERSDNNTYSTFKRYDPTTADSQHTSTKKACEDIPVVTKKFVHVSSDLNFKNDSSSGFSLLAKFSEQNDRHENNEINITRPRRTYEEENFEEFPKSRKFNKVKNFEENYPAKNFNPTPKSRNFFWQSSDPAFQEAVEWLTTPLTEDNKAEFASARDELVELYKLRQSRAKREYRPTRGRRNRNEKNFGIGRSKF